jgi:D-alanyl-D-alanine carboxypeptidase
MSGRLSIRPAQLSDLETLIGLRREASLEMRRDTSQAGPSTAKLNRPELRSSILDRCVLTGRTGGRIVAMSCLDLGTATMREAWVARTWRGSGFGRRMVTETERLAVRFGMTRLAASSSTRALPFLKACGYRPVAGAMTHTDKETGLEIIHVERSFPRRQTRYGARIRRLLNSIGIDPDYGRQHRLMLQEECRELAAIGKDALGREQMLRPRAARAWLSMRRAAEGDGIQLQAASSFRSVGYQVSIIERKKQAGQDLAQILEVSAAPGFSEHHTGRAVDVATPGSEPLEVEFETTPAFEWLLDSAAEFGFRMSYPRNNRHGIAYEPWHWFFVGK